MNEMCGGWGQRQWGGLQVMLDVGGQSLNKV